MANTSHRETARRLLNACLASEPWQHADVDALVDGDADELLTVVAEGLADRFDPLLAGVYSQMFSYAIARADPRFESEGLQLRHHQVRRAAPYRPADSPRVARIREVEEKALQNLRAHGAYRVPGVEKHGSLEDELQPGRIVLLSRVTLGSDIAVTSVIAQALRTRFPESEVVLAGGKKSAELLGLPLLAVDYPRTGGLKARLRALDVFADLEKDAVVVDPDSRLTQLGLYPVAPEDRYYFFDSHETDDPGSLTELARAWCAEVFEVDIPRPKIAAGDPPFEFARPAVTVSLGVGGNESKRVGAEFERMLLRDLSGRAATVIVDKGAGEAEAAIAEAAGEGLPNVRYFSGSFAGFASLIAKSDLYVGYDSAGQHAAAALEVPLVCVFAGAANDRFFERWRPDGRVVRVDGGSQESVFLRVRSALPAF